MHTHATRPGVTLPLVLAALALPAAAEIVSITGFTQAEVTEYRFDAPGDTDRASESFPGTAAELPLQVVARLLSAIADEEAAAAAAAQFADPRELAQPNPEEFAINLALNSISPHIRYQARAVSQETRGVVFAPAELGPFVQTGDTIDLTGRLFLDGALAIFAIDPDRDLSDAAVLLRVTVVQSSHSGAEQTVFSGELELRGGTGGSATAVAAGGFPRRSVILTDLSSLVDDFAAFHVLIIPNITIDYDYTAVAGQEFSLRATVEVEAANVAGECGVAAVIGTPVDTLRSVVELTQGTEAAAKMISALETERAEPTGQPAFPEAQPAFGLLSGCGLLGFESLVGATVLAGMRRRRVGIQS